MSRPLSFLLMAALGVVFVAAIYVAEWLWLKQARYDGLLDRRVLAPVQERVHARRMSR